MNESLDGGNKATATGGPMRNGRPIAVLVVAVLAVSAVGYFLWSQQKAAFESLPKAAQADGLTKEMRAMMEEWSQPEEGRLAGEVVGMDDFGIVIEDFDGHHWYAISKPGEVPGRDEYATFAQRVRVVGESIGDMNFEAKEFLPWVDPPSGS